MMEVGSESLFPQARLLLCSVFFSDAEVCVLFTLGREK